MLERADIETGSRDMETKQGSEGNSLAGEGTSRLVWTLKQSEAARGTHWLDVADVGTGQNMERK